MPRSTSSSSFFEETSATYQQDLQEKKALLEAAFPFIAQDGWGEKTLEKGALQLGLDPAVVWCLFPEGVVDALYVYHNLLDQRMVEKMEAMPLETMGMTEKITWCVRTRLCLMGETKPVAVKAARFLAKPSYLSLGKQWVSETVHKMWVVAGDTSTDYNFYTKRFLLTAVYGSTLLYWMRDMSPNHQKTWAFLEKRIQNVLLIQKIKPLCAAPVEQFQKGFSHFKDLFNRFKL
ncbi:MAG: COQ9 family protein [Alphaproteobacteria bacterium]